MFKINIGVAYGSDVDLVKEVLKNCAITHKQVIKDGNTDVRLSNFGNSSLDFVLLFSSSNIFDIERIKSDIRFEISKKFKEHTISIPYPQMDVHIVDNK